MIEVDTSSLKQCLNFSIIARTIIDGVSACIVLEGLASHNELRIGYNFERVWTRLRKESTNVLKRKKEKKTKNKKNRKVAY